MKPATPKSFYYPDIPIFLIGIPYISAFNYYLTYSNIQFNDFLLLTFTIDTVQGYVAWYAVRAIIIFFDKKIPYESNLVKRIIIQLIITTAAGLTIIALATEMVSWIARGRPAPLDFYSMDLLIISIWFLVINGVYIGIYFYRRLALAELENVMKKPKEPGLVIKTGNQNILVKHEDIHLFYVDGEYVQLLSSNGKKYLLDQSLDKLENKLPIADYFRLNRQCIVHRQVVSGFKRVENGKLQVQLNFKTDLPQELTVSRTKAPAFKGWFLTHSYIPQEKVLPFTK